MCGIVGIFGYHQASPQVDREEVRRVRDYMTARGPDGKGEWFSSDGRVGLGHRRLAIIDLSDGGAQPMCNHDGTLVVSFNGEVYNYRRLKKQLEAKGYVFRSQSDTEVLLHLYKEKGEGMVHDLRGMFAFAIWDAQKNALFLARDPYGIKPLYYADDGWVFRTASQVKALLAGGVVSKEVEPASVAGFFLWGSIPEPFTWFRDIRALPAGSHMWVDHTGPREPKRYYALLRNPSLTHARTNERQASVRQALLDSVRHHLVSDVPVGAFLSAGVDSGAIVGLAREVKSGTLETVTLSFEEYRGTRNDEAPLAKHVAHRYNANHREWVLTLKRFQEELPRIFAVIDQPTIDGINSYFVSLAARETGLKVALSGLGGDELFRGYPAFQDIPRLVKATCWARYVPGLGPISRRIASKILPDGVTPKLASTLEYGKTLGGAYLLRRGLFMPWELAGLIAGDLANEGIKRLKPLQVVNRELQEGKRSPVNLKVMALESSLYMRNQLLRDMDWASMAHSLEVRVPLVDTRLFETVAPQLPFGPHSNGKEIMAHSVTPPLPAEVINRAKTGFNVPIAHWLDKIPEHNEWHRVPALGKPGVHWSRRWAYTIYRHWITD